MEEKVINRPSRWSKYHKEPHFSALMQAIKKVRFAGWTIKQACAKYKIPNRSLRRYIQISSDEKRRDSPFYLPRQTLVQARSQNNAQKHEQLPPIHYGGTSCPMIPASGPNKPTMTMLCEPATVPYEHVQCKDQFQAPEDDFSFYTLSGALDDTGFEHYGKSLTTSSSTAFSPKANDTTATIKLPSMMDSTNQMTANMVMEEASPDLECPLEIDDSHIQCFLDDIAEIDFGF